MKESAPLPSPRPLSPTTTDGGHNDDLTSVVLRKHTNLAGAASVLSAGAGHARPVTLLTHVDEIGMQELKAIDPNKVSFGFAAFYRWYHHHDDARK